MPGAESSAKPTSSAKAAPAAAPAPFKPIRSVVDAVFARATPVYHKVTPYVTPVYDRVTPLLPAGVVTAASNAANAVTTKVLLYAPVANAAVDAVDARAAGVVEYIHSKESSLPSLHSLPAVAIPATWVTAANNAVKPLLNKTEVITEVRGKIVSFYNAAVQTLLELKEKNATAVKREEFVRELRTKLAHQWDERLQKPAEELYEKSKTLVLTQVDAVSKNEHINSLRAALGEQWEKNVTAVYHARLEAPLSLLYQTAAAYYLSLYHKGGEQAATLAAYLSGLKASLATSYPQYSERIEPLLVKAYDAIRAVVAKLPLPLKKASPSQEQTHAANAASAALAAGQKAH